MSQTDASPHELRKRMAQLEEVNTQLMQRMAQIERERVEYLQNVAHQLVAPLNAIKWHIENLTEARVGIERAKKVLRSVYSQATLAVHLAKNFNLMSNLEADHALSKLKEPLQDIDLRRLLVNLADDFQPLAWDRNVNIVVDNTRFDARPSVLAMKPLISQVFSNIIENAVKYSDPDTQIVIQGRYVAESDSFSVFVHNQGIRLHPDQEKRIFERGFRSVEAERRYPAGTGFGLYIAKRIVEIHEGKLEASTRDGWIVFEVRLSVRGLEGKARLRG